jgi:hypothetical protein
MFGKSLYHVEEVMLAGRWLFFPADNGAHKLSVKHKEGHKLPGILKNGEKQIT